MKTLSLLSEKQENTNTHKLRKKLLEPIEQKFIGELSTKEINKWLKTAKAQ